MTNLYQVISKIIIIIFAITVVLLSCFPLFWMLSSALKPYEESFAIPPTLIPKLPTIGNFIELFDVTNVAMYFWNSTLIAVGATVIAVTLSVLSGYALSRSNSWFS